MTDHARTSFETSSLQDLAAASSSSSVPPNAPSAADELEYRQHEEKCNSYLFANLCSAFEKAAIIGDRMQKYETLFPKKIQKDLIGHSPYPVVRLIVPEIDTGRPVYNCKQKTIASFYIKYLSLVKDTPDYERLKNWRDPTRGGAHSAAARQQKGTAAGSTGASSYLVASGEFSDVLADVISQRLESKTSRKTIGDVNRVLDELAAATDEAGRRKAFQDIQSNYDPREQKWLVRIIIRDLKIGVKHEGLLKEFHPKAYECYSACCDLRKVCYFLTEPQRLTAAGGRLAVFQPFTPMLAKGFSGQGAKGQLSGCLSALKGHSFTMDIKLDGERILCHKKGQQVSRSLSDGGPPFSLLLSLFLPLKLRSIRISIVAAATKTNTGAALHAPGQRVHENLRAGAR